MTKPEAAAVDLARSGGKTMHATLSLYVTNERLEDAFTNWTPKTRRSLQEKQAASRELSRAIDPLFNDIAIRDRNAAVDEFLVDLDGAGFVEPIRISIPASIQWETEGQCCQVRLGGEVVRDVEARTFWYVHSNGALSFHISMRLGYEHTLADFYVLSVLQKLMFPKEFQAPGGSADLDICSGKTGLWVLDTPMLSCRAEIAGEEGRNKTEPSGGRGGWASLPFWTFVRRLTGIQIAKLAREASLQPQGEALDPRGLWDALIACDATTFIEVSGLRAPPARSAFLLLDRELFQLLQPEARERLHASSGYAPLVPTERKEVMVIEPAAVEVEARLRGADFDIRYYFLAGFFQNIIDFLNQDVSELRDGTDAIYPRTKEQEKEALFVRFANGRSLFQVVASSRSLDVGKGYIGTCPYLFLVHLRVLHNEFLVRRYEAEIARLQEELESKELTRFGSLQALLKKMAEEAKAGVTVSARDIQQATARFYEFRLRAFTFFKQHLYDNTLRYDTERDLFNELQRIRGIETRLARCDAIVDGIDRTIKDLEDDKRYREQSEARRADSRLQQMVFAVGVIALAQALFQAVDAYRALFQSKDGNVPRCDLARWRTPHQLCEAANMADAASMVLIVATVFGTAILLVYLLRMVVRSTVAPRP